MNKELKRKELKEYEDKLYKAYWEYVSRYNGLSRMDVRVRVLTPNQIINMIKGVNNINY